MKNRFVRKVNSERDVLSIVNKAYGMPTLNGLSREAIEAWRVNNKKSSSNVIRIITNISKRLVLESDVSRNVFDQEDIEKLEPVENYIIQLQRYLEETERIFGVRVKTR